MPGTVQHICACACGRVAEQRRLRSGARQGKACGFSCKLAPVIHRNTLDYRKLRFNPSWCQ